MSACQFVRPREKTLFSAHRLVWYFISKNFIAILPRKFKLG